ncbi:hypothetical protein H920_12588 [Fukomys damarensis]|uniref:Uncharacterized protein n=1 Tax=Fukomys damarensis TaxID=885580 RepID=A0A091D4Q7_FUKDA|nr:hypothetical protein H920_12588 [Fukomys damarensis]
MGPASPVTPQRDAWNPLSVFFPLSSLPPLEEATNRQIHVARGSSGRHSIGGIVTAVEAGCSLEQLCSIRPLFHLKMVHLTVPGRLTIYTHRIILRGPPYTLPPKRVVDSEKNVGIMVQDEGGPTNAEDDKGNKKMTPSSRRPQSKGQKGQVTRDDCHHGRRTKAMGAQSASRQMQSGLAMLTTPAPGGAAEEAVEDRALRAQHHHSHDWVNGRRQKDAPDSLVTARLASGVLERKAKPLQQS